jgi:polyphosphate kinase
MFNFITGYGRPADYRKVLVSPTTMRKQIHEEIERVIETKRRGGTARIAMKMNALVDAGCIRDLYGASQAGVRVDLNIRGICCLRPGIPGISDNISVNSVVGRFLEHSRIYSFEREGETRVYMGSADLMPRNLDHRVELVAPVEDRSLRDEVMDIVERSLADNTNAWTLGTDGRWTRIDPGGEPPRNVQAELREWHAARAAEHLATASE